MSNMVRWRPERGNGLFCRGNDEAYCGEIEAVHSQAEHTVPLNNLQLLIFQMLALVIDFFLTSVSPRWPFPHWKFGLFFPGKASCDRVALPNQQCMCFHNPPNSDMNYKVFNVRIDVKNCMRDCLRG